MGKSIILTADDIIREGACASGVYDVLERMHPNVKAAMPVHIILKSLEEDEKEYVVDAAKLDGYGNGNGDGYGNGNGYGYGYGNGYGYGDGNGYGDGYGDGYGNGNGYGYGDGYG